MEDLLVFSAGLRQRSGAHVPTGLAERVGRPTLGSSKVYPFQYFHRRTFRPFRFPAPAVDFSTFLDRFSRMIWLQSEIQADSLLLIPRVAI
jgi:hypothetical protein